MQDPSWVHIWNQRCMNFPKITLKSKFPSQMLSQSPREGLPEDSPPFLEASRRDGFMIFTNCISRYHISDLWTGIFSVGSLNATFHCHCFTLFQCFSSFFSSPPFWRHIAKSDFLIFGNHISRDHISDLWTGISSVGSLNATFHCHCFTLFQCFSSFFSSPSQIS